MIVRDIIVTDLSTNETIHALKTDIIIDKPVSNSMYDYYGNVIAPTSNTIIFTIANDQPHDYFRNWLEGSITRRELIIEHDGNQLKIKDAFIRTIEYKRDTVDITCHFYRVEIIDHVIKLERIVVPEELFEL